MIDPGQIMVDLDRYAGELDALTQKFGEIEDRLEPIEAEYDLRRDNAEVGMWDKHERGGKLPSAEMREKLARREMPAELLTSRRTLLNERQKLEKESSRIKAAVDAKRSILSALKVEAESSGAGLRRAA